MIFAHGFHSFPATVGWMPFLNFIDDRRPHPTTKWKEVKQKITNFERAHTQMRLGWVAETIYKIANGKVVCAVIFQAETPRFSH